MQHKAFNVNVKERLELTGCWGLLHSRNQAFDAGNGKTTANSNAQYRV